MRDEPVLDLCPDSGFFGRARETEYLAGRAVSAGGTMPGVLVVGGRWTGRTELLKRVHRRLFWKQSVIPIYYRLTGSPEDFASDFIKTSVKQYMAYTLRDPEVARAEVPLHLLEKRLLDNPETRGAAVLIRRDREARKAGEASTVLRNALSAPRLLNLSENKEVFLILDDLDLVLGKGPGREIIEMLSSLGRPFAASISTGARLEAALSGLHVERLDLGGLEAADAVSLMSELARDCGVGVDAATLGRAAARLGGNPFYMRNLVWAAHRSGRQLRTLRDFAEVYAGEIAAGNTGASTAALIGAGGNDGLRLLHILASARRDLAAEELSAGLGLEACEVEGLVDRLSGPGGIVGTGFGASGWTGDGVMLDVLAYAFDTRVRGKDPREARTALVREVLKESSREAAGVLKGSFSEEVRELISSFDGGSLPARLFSFTRFAGRGAGGGPDGGVRRLAGGADVRLPSVIGAYDPDGEEGPRIIAAEGFQDRGYGAGSEVVWLVGVKESANPVNMGDAGNFLRRAATLRSRFRGPRVVAWMVGREGFTDEAAERLETSGVLTSDFFQVGAIREALCAGAEEPARAAAPERVSEYSMSLPRGPRAELVAARAAEEIASAMGFDADSLAQIKAALVEACINAFEHSRTRTTTVHLRFLAADDRLTINVQNWGASYSGSHLDRAPGTPVVMDGKRGWGIELMKGLMDEVRFEKLPEGTRITLVKHLLNRREAGDDREA